MPKIDIDPLAEVTWGLAMAVAWISYRSADRVREARRDAIEWLEAFDEPLDIAEQSSTRMPVTTARDALLGALQQGHLIATGVSVDRGLQINIPAGDWRNLYPKEGRGEIDELRWKPEPGPVAYQKVELLVADLIRLWPPIELATASDSHQVASKDLQSPGQAPRKPSSEADIKRACKRAIGFMNAQGHSALTRHEAGQLLAELYDANPRAQIREIIEKQIEPAATRRTQRQLANRSNELEDCRQFLKAAT